jgi:hypothetical protein
MAELNAEVGGVRYLCKSDGTCVAESGVYATGIMTDLFFRNVFELGSGKYVLKGISVMAGRNMETVRIPKNVEKIDKRCFYECRSLCEITFESRSELREIGENAFYYSGLKSIQIPKNVEKIDECCFYGCESLCEVTFESLSELKEIGENAFACSGVKSIQIPRNVEWIHGNCFHRCSLCEVMFEGKPRMYGMFQNCAVSVLRVPVGMDLTGFDLPRSCRIEYF